VEGIINETNARRPDKQQHGYLKCFYDRKAPNFDFFDNNVTFQLECYFKNFQDGLVREQDEQMPAAPIVVDAHKTIEEEKQIIN